MIVNTKDMRGNNGTIDIIIANRKEDTITTKAREVIGTEIDTITMNQVEEIIEIETIHTVGTIQIQGLIMHNLRKRF